MKLRLTSLTLLAALPLVAAADPLLVVCAGDSITQGIGTPQAPDKSFPESYPAQLAEILGDGYAVTNFGVGGRTLLRQADPYGYGRALQAGGRIVVIGLGTNDSKPYAWDAHGAEFEADYAKMVRDFQARPEMPRILLCLPPPVFHGGQWGIREEVLSSAIRPAILRVAESCGVETIDLATPLADAAPLFPDRVHPNPTGARRIAELVAAAIRREDAPKPLPVVSVPRISTPPVVDGDLSDAIWDSAALLDGLQPPLDPVPDAPALQRTSVRIAWEPTALYVAFACVDADVLCSGTMHRDDDLSREDAVEVFLDPVGDGRAFFEFQVAPDGTLFDAVHLYTATPETLGDGRIRPDIVRTDRWSMREWDLPGYEAAARRTPDGWTAELRIPAAPLLRRLGRERLDIRVAPRAQFVRCDHDGPAFFQQYWSPCIHGNPHNSPARYGTLRLIQ